MFNPAMAKLRLKPPWKNQGVTSHKNGLVHRHLPVPKTNVFLHSLFLSYTPNTQPNVIYIYIYISERKQQNKLFSNLWQCRPCLAAGGCLQWRWHRGLWRHRAICSAISFGGPPPPPKGTSRGCVVFCESLKWVGFLGLRVCLTFWRTPKIVVLFLVFL